jgi:DNA-directed RNA polymerase specialized sigma24 family protein
MNSVGLSASASAASAGAPALSAEADLVRLAARGDAESFDELYRRHGPTAWRLAQAASVDRDAAVWAVGEGFVRALRGARRGPAALDEDGGFRPLVLAAVYRSAMDHVRATGHAAAASGPIPSPTEPEGGQARRRRAKAADAALVESAFRSLPERWRAAVWLGEVEGMPAEQAAPILGVSIPVATQLVNRGTRGLTGRFTQAHRTVPQHLGTALRPLALTVPATLADVTAARWAEAQHERGNYLAPVTTWLSERAVRPLWVAVGSLMGLGLIGLGLAGEGAAVANGPTAAGRDVPGSAVGVNSSAGPFTLPSQTNPAAPGTGILASFGGTFGGGATGDGFGGFLLTGSPAAGVGTGGGDFGGSTGSGGSSSGGGGTGGTLPGGGTIPGTPGGTSPGTTLPGTGPQTILTVPGVATVTNTGGPPGTTSVNVLPSGGGGGLATVTLGCSTGVGVSVGGTQVGCTTTTTKPAPTTTKPPSTTTTSTTSTTTPLGGLLGGVPTTLPNL